MSPDGDAISLYLARQIEASGPISVAEFMRVANTAYYDRADPLGAKGDFITAPEISQMFGEMVGMWLTDIWLRRNTPSDCHYVELGPGRGTLAADALRAMARFDFVPDVHFVETSSALRNRQAEAVPVARFHEGIADLPETGPLLIIANEFFDALPVRQFIATEDGWRERMITHQGDQGFVAAPGAQTADAFVPAHVRGAPDGSIYESAPAASDIVFALCARLQKQGGVLLVIDYGYAEPGLGGTLQAVQDHGFSDPFAEPGSRDLSAHVNFGELANLGRMREMQLGGPVSQGQWLRTLGIDMRAEVLVRHAPDRAEEIMAARDRLVDADQMGDLFKVMTLAAPDWPKPEGFGMS